MRTKPAHCVRITRVPAMAQQTTLEIKSTATLDMLNNLIGTLNTTFLPLVTNFASTANSIIQSALSSSTGLLTAALNTGSTLINATLGNSTGLMGTGLTALQNVVQTGATNLSTFLIGTTSTPGLIEQGILYQRSMPWVK